MPVLQLNQQQVHYYAHKGEAENNGGAQEDNCRISQHLRRHGLQKGYVFQDKNIEAVDTSTPAGGEGVKVAHQTVQNNVTDLEDNQHNASLLP